MFCFGRKWSIVIRTVFCVADNDWNLNMCCVKIFQASDQKIWFFTNLIQFFFLLNGMLTQNFFFLILNISFMKSWLCPSNGPLSETPLPFYSTIKICISVLKIRYNKLKNNTLFTHHDCELWSSKQICLKNG